MEVHAAVMGNQRRNPAFWRVCESTPEVQNVRQTARMGRFSCSKKRQILIDIICSPLYYNNEDRQRRVSVKALIQDVAPEGSVLRAL